MTSKTHKLTAVILAAGKGTRMRSTLPKVLHKICGRTLLNRTLRAVAGLYPDKIIVVTGYGEQLLKDELAELGKKTLFHGIEVSTVFQQEQNGTGHALQVGLSAFEGDLPILVVPGDTPLLTTAILANLAQTARERSSDLAFMSCRNPSPKGLGRIVRAKDGSLEGIVEERDCSVEQRQITEVNTSIYLGTRELFDRALANVEPANAQGEYYLTDVVRYGVKNNFRVSAVLTDNVAAVAGANTRYELSALESIRRAEINKQLMEAGVTFEDPASTYVDDGVDIAPDTYLGAGCRLKGTTRIERDVVLEGDTLIENSSIGKGTRVRLSCYLQDAVVGASCTVGPFAHLRPATVLGDNVKIGNFVETKKALLKEGTKAGHLSYLGDAEIGPGANIGAGTITCNYDGANKNNTTIGEGAFIGSNSALVAPITVGNEAYVGAGSTITKDVPDKSLAVARGRQKNIDGWVERNKS